MAAKSSQRTEGRAAAKTVATMIREAIARNGYKDVKECARSIKVPYDLFNKVVGGHIPKDAQLIEYARKLQIDSRELVLAAYREKAPEEMKQYFNSVALLDEHSDSVRELMQIIDTLNSDQLDELLQVARMLQGSPRTRCRKAIALLTLYQEMPEELVEHFDGLVQLSLRREDLPGLHAFQEALAYQKNVRSGRRGRLHA